MKPCLSVILACIFVLTLKSQAVFCPPGAEWNYNFSIPGPNIPKVLETIKYIGDSVVNTEHVKVLKHSRFFLSCNTISPGNTFIKQKGDTVFLKNSLTANTWQILYNFNVTPGQSWETELTTSTYTTYVNSVYFISENGFNMKRLSVRVVTEIGMDTLQYNCAITERFGNNYFLFGYHNPGSWGCDLDWIWSPLCYTDNEFGTKKFTSLACDNVQAIDVGVAEYKKNVPDFKIYPNPASHVLNLVFTPELASANKQLRLEVLNSLGQVVIVLDLAASSARLDISALEKGIYFIQVEDKDRRLAIQKFIKE